MEQTDSSNISNPMKSLDSRVAALSPSQLRLLAHRLQQYDVEASRSELVTGESVAERQARVQLVAYYSLKAEATENDADGEKADQSTVSVVDGIEKSELVSLVQNALPAFMQPAQWVALSAFPRLPNGKLAPGLLPDPPARPDSLRSESITGLQSRNFSVLAGVLGELLGITEIRMDDNFFELGGDSITAMQLVSRAREAGVMIDVASVTKKPTIAALAEPSEPVDDMNEVISAYGLTPLTPIQSWFFSIGHEKPEHWNLGGVLNFKHHLDTQVMCEAIFLVMNRYPALGSNFNHIDGQWRASIPETSPPEKIVSVESEPCEFDSEYLQTRIQQMQQDFSLAEGWLIRFRIIHSEDRSAGRLAWVAHHLVVDSMSINQIFSEIAVCYTSLSSGFPPPDKVLNSVSLREWALRLDSVANALKKSNSGNGIESHQPPSVQSHATESTSSTRVLELSEDMTEKLLRCNSALTTGTHELILYALGETLCEFAGTDQLCIDIEHHGRDVLGDDVDASQSIGWFTSFFPFEFAGSVSAYLREHLRWMKESFRTAKIERQYHLLDMYSNNGIANPDASTQEPAFWPMHPHLKFPRILFNFQGNLDGSQNHESRNLWLLEQKQWNILRWSGNYRSHELEINSWVADNKLNMVFHYAQCSADDTLISGIADSLQNNFLAIIECSTNETFATYTPSDFPEANMSQNELDAFIDSLD